MWRPIGCHVTPCLQVVSFCETLIKFCVIIKEITKEYNKREHEEWSAAVDYGTECNSERREGQEEILLKVSGI